MFSWTDYTFWAIESLAFAWVALSIARAKSIGEWKWLFVFCSLQTAVSVALFGMLLLKNWPAYFYTQWCSEIAFGILKLLILWHIVCNALPRLHMAPRGINRFFIVVTAASGSFAFAYGLIGIGSAASFPIKVLILNRSVSMSVMGIFFTFAIFSSFFQLKWKSRALRVDMGLNLMAAADLLSFLVETSLRGKVLLAYHFQAAVHIGALIVWCRAFYLIDPAPETATEYFLGTARQINRELR